MEPHKRKKLAERQSCDGHHAKKHMRSTKKAQRQHGKKIIDKHIKDV